MQAKLGKVQSKSQPREVTPKDKNLLRTIGSIKGLSFFGR